MINSLHKFLCAMQTCSPWAACCNRWRTTWLDTCKKNVIWYRRIRKSSTSYMVRIGPFTQAVSNICGRRDPEDASWYLQAADSSQGLSCLETVYLGPGHQAVNVCYVILSECTHCARCPWCNKWDNKWDVVGVLRYFMLCMFCKARLACSALLVQSFIPPGDPRHYCRWRVHMVVLTGMCDWQWTRVLAMCWCKSQGEHQNAEVLSSYI